MSENKLEAILMNKVDMLPRFMFNPVLNEVMEALDDPGTDVTVVADKIAADRTLSYHLIANTAHTAQRSVSNVQQAVRLMGLKTVKQFIQSTLESEHKPPEIDGATMEIMQGRLWNHSQLVAICCQLIAAEWDYPNLAGAYTAGLFHDLGKAILNAFAFDEISDAIKLTQAKAIATFTAEDRALGFNHSYFGAKILERWGMPPAIVEPVRLHHAPREAQINKKLVKIVHLADAAVNCQQTKLPLGISLFPVDKYVLAEMPFPKERLMELAGQAADLLSKIEQQNA